MQIHDLLTHCVKESASDLHIAAGQSPSIRLDGVIRQLGTPPLTNEQATRMIYSIMNERQKAQFEENMELDFSLGLAGLCRFRVNVYLQLHGIGAAFRAIPDEVQTIDQLGLPLVLRDIAKLRRGMVLVTGPTGHGKTTTLASIIHEINQNRFEHIITVEDPIEYQHRPAKCIISQRELNSHTKSFAAALRSSLREDPDVILVGEMRDLDTISLALTAAETGHLVLATLHTRSAADTVNRIIDVFPKEQQHQVRNMMANSLEAVVCQQLVPRKSRGRVCATEVLMVNFAVANLIREGKVFQIPTLMQTQTTSGMVTMEQSLLHLFRNGTISRDTLLERSYDTSALEKMDEVTGAKAGRSRTRGGR